jgi:hypothetical protein
MVRTTPNILTIIGARLLFAGGSESNNGCSNAE